jgi:glycosyltransferase involved in cell wall biosynthesis
MKLLILRGSSQYVNPLVYNVQEIGLAKVLARRGWKIRIISSGPVSKTVVPADGVEWVECKRIGLSKNLGWPRGTLRKIREFGPDIIQVQDILTPSTILAAVAEAQARVPLVLSMGEYPKGKVTRDLAREVLAMFMKNRYSAVLCKTTTSARYCERLGMPKVSVCPVGIDPEAYSPPSTREDMDWVRAIEEKRRHGRRILCHVGRLDKLDNIPFLMQVLGHLPVEYEMLVAGEPREYGLKVAQQFGVSERATFVGSVPNRNIGTVFENSLATLSCSTFEPYGLSATESLYYGCPVFAHPTGGLVDIVVNGHNGIHVPIREPRTWASVIHETVDGGALDLLRANAATTGYELTWSHRALAYERVYLEVLKRSSPLS